jgi:hypothetical protein
VQVRGNDDAELGAGIDVDVGVDASLANQFELGKALQQRPPDLGSLSDEDQGLCLRETPGEHVDLVDVIGEHSDLVIGQLLEAPECPEAVEVVIENGDAHPS